MYEDGAHHTHNVCAAAIPTEAKEMENRDAAAATKRTEKEEFFLFFILLCACMRFAYLRDETLAPVSRNFIAHIPIMANVMAGGVCVCGKQTK